jgi:tetratricopeptide (TPR) repeat protein
VYVQPEASRKAVAREAGTTIVSIGAKPGEAFEVGGWEVNAEMMPLYEAGDYAGAAALLERALQDDPGHQMLLYNLACMEALSGRKDEAVGHLGQALGGAPERYFEMARNDSDLESIRDDPRVAELLAPKS